MQVSAYTIAKLYGIEALTNFYSVDNHNEIAQCRQDWVDAHAIKVCLKSFNDGNNIFEVFGDLDNLTAWRTDDSGDVSKEYAVELFEAYTSRNDKRGLFGIVADMDMLKLTALFNKE